MDCTYSEKLLEKWKQTENSVKKNHWTFSGKHSVSSCSSALNKVSSLCVAFVFILFNLYMFVYLSECMFLFVCVCMHVHSCMCAFMYVLIPVKSKRMVLDPLEQELLYQLTWVLKSIWGPWEEHQVWCPKYIFIGTLSIHQFSVSESPIPARSISARVCPPHWLPSTGWPPPLFLFSIFLFQAPSENYSFAAWGRGVLFNSTMKVFQLPFWVHSYLKWD